MGREESLRVKQFALILVKGVRIPNSRLPLNNELSFRVMFWSLGEGSQQRGYLGRRVCTAVGFSLLPVEAKILLIGGKVVTSLIMDKVDNVCDPGEQRIKLLLKQIERNDI